MSKSKVRSQPRDRATGRYSFDGKLERLCRCAKLLGTHLAEPPHPGLAEVDGVKYIIHLCSHA